MTTKEYSVNYSSATGASGSIVLPGGGSSSNAKCINSKNQGVVITPEPALVIKTRLMKRVNSEFSNESTKSFLNIAGDGGTDGENGASSLETKVFINVCSHELITLPTKRKTIDDEGAEVDGWHLPMSMGVWESSGRALIKMAMQH